jgi:hypothetical protein
MTVAMHSMVFDRQSQPSVTANYSHPVTWTFFFVSDRFDFQHNVHWFYCFQGCAEVTQRPSLAAPCFVLERP